MVLMNRLNARSVITLGAGKYNNGANLLFHKRKNEGAQWLYRYPFIKYPFLTFVNV